MAEWLGVWRVRTISTPSSWPRPQARPDAHERAVGGGVADGFVICGKRTVLFVTGRGTRYRTGGGGGEPRRSSTRVKARRQVGWPVAGGRASPNLAQGRAAGEGADAVGWWGPRRAGY